MRLAGDATIGNSNGRWDLGDPGLSTVISTGGSNYNLTCLQGNYSEWHEVTIDTNLGNIDYILTSANSWEMEGMGSSLGNPTNTITLHSGVQLDISHGNNGDDNGYAKIVHAVSGAQFTYRPGGGAGDYLIKTSLQLDGGAGMNFYNGNGGNNTGTHIGGTVTFNGLAHISIGDSTVTFTNVLSGPGGFYWDSYNNLLTFAADQHLYRSESDWKWTDARVDRKWRDLSQLVNILRRHRWHVCCASMQAADRMGLLPSRMVRLSRESARSRAT